MFETYSGSFLYHDSHFEGVDTLLRMDMKDIYILYSMCLADALIQGDLVCSHSKLLTLLVAARTNLVKIRWILN